MVQKSDWAIYRENDGIYKEFKKDKENFFEVYKDIILNEGPIVIASVHPLEYPHCRVYVELDIDMSSEYFWDKKDRERGFREIFRLVEMQTDFGFTYTSTYSTLEIALKYLRQSRDKLMRIYR